MIELIKENFPDATVGWEKTTIPSDLYKVKQGDYFIYIEQFPNVVLMTMFKRHESGHYENMTGASNDEMEDILKYIKLVIQKDGLQDRHPKQDSGEDS